MQVFSDMRRNSSNPNYLKIFLVALSLVLLQIFSNLFQFFPTLVGLFFAYIVINIKNEEKFIYVVFSFLYLSYYELNKGFFLFSYILLFVIFYNFFYQKIENSFKCKNCILFIYVVVAYIGHFFLNAFGSYVLKLEFPSFSYEYFYYIAFDFIICVLFFRSKI
jgi:hypothetical protein